MALLLYDAATLTQKMDDLKNKTLTLRGKELSLELPVVMGILNTTPDSFSDGGQFIMHKKAIGRIEEMIGQGAAIIDVGGESTRPGAEPVSAETEAERVIPVLEEAVSLFPNTFFSVDTTKYSVAKQALEAGAHIVNDVSGLRKEPELADLCANYNAGYILMHSLKDPKTMQENPDYDDVVDDILQFLTHQTKILSEKGVQSIIVDPGIGFGKTTEHNLRIIKELKKFSTLKYPVMLGASRKSMIGNVLNERPVDGRLAGTVAAHYHGLMNGADILRVHDVEEAADSVEMFNRISKS
jgi:dihydropteroate synthase